MPDVDHQIIETIEVTPALLEELFGSEENYGTIREDEGDGDLFPDGRRVTQCTSWATYVRRVFLDRSLGYGFFHYENPTSKIAAEWDGHDFAVIDGRYIVDGWLREVACMGDRVVFDLLDPSDAALIEILYGDKEKWKMAKDDPRLESEPRRQDVMASTRFQEVLDRHLTATPTP